MFITMHICIGMTDIQRQYDSRSKELDPIDVYDGPVDFQFDEILNFKVE